MIQLINKSNYKKSYIIALFAILFFITISIINMILMISHHSQYAELINKSGKQRMLSQRIVFLSTQYTKNNPNDIEQYINEFKENHKFLTSRELSYELKEIYYNYPHKLDDLFNNFINTNIKYIQTQDKNELNKIIHIQNDILESLDKVVLEIEKESRKFSQLMVMIEILIFLFIAILLFLISRYIFKPMLKKIEKERKADKISKKNLEKIVNQKTKKLKESLDIINHYVFSSKTDKDGIITYVSDAFCELTGYSKEELIGRTHRIIKHPDTPSHEFKTLWETITSGKTYQGEVRNMKKNGEEFWLGSHIRPDFDENNEIIGYIAYRKDITHEKMLEVMNEKLEKMVESKTKELQESNEELLRTSQTDALTGIYNRKKLKDTLSLKIKKASRYDDQFSIILIDIDHFKNVNDTYGHLVGDKVIIGICNLISTNIREIDLFARWGGEEFVILVNNQNINQAELIALKLKEKICESKIEKLNITCSFGVAQYTKNDTSESIFKKADKALYKAKESGRNCVILGQ